MGVLVPPCLMMVILASLTDLSVAALFMAGFLPAAAMAVLLMVLIYVQARRENLPREPRPSLAEVGRACARGVLPLIAPVIILGGILGGIVTPTEAAVLAVLYALLLGLVDLPRDPPARPDAVPDQHRVADGHGDAAGRHRLRAVVDLRGAGQSRG